MSEKRMVYAEDVIQRIRDLAPEILGGWYNPDMENELEQLVCVVENTPTAAAADAQRWRYTAEEPPKEEDGKYHDLVTDMLVRAIHSVGNEYADEIAAYEEERRMRRSYYEKVENRANGGASDDGEESDH